MLPLIWIWPKRIDTKRAKRGAKAQVIRKWWRIEKKTQKGLRSPRTCDLQCAIAGESMGNCQYSMQQHDNPLLDAHVKVAQNDPDGFTIFRSNYIPHVVAGVYHYLLLQSLDTVSIVTFSPWHPTSRRHITCSFREIPRFWNGKSINAKNTTTLPTTTFGINADCRIPSHDYARVPGIEPYRRQRCATYPKPVTVLIEG